MTVIVTHNSFKADVDRVPEGASEVFYEGRTYGLTRTHFNNGKSIKVFAEELGGNNFISFNAYYTRQGLQIKPCEMELEEVVSFLQNFQTKPE